MSVMEPMKPETALAIAMLKTESLHKDLRALAEDSGLRWEILLDVTRVVFKL